MARRPAHSTSHDFSLMRGGPFHAFVHRLGLDTPERPIRTAVLRAAGALLVAWVPTLLLSTLGWRDEPGPRAFLADRFPQAELLFALPVLFASEGYVDGRIAAAVKRPLLLGLLSPVDVARFDAALRGAALRRDSRRADGAALLLALALTFIQFRLRGLEFVLFSQDGTLIAAGAWYVLLGLPLLWFLLLRWVERYAIWAGVLFALSRLDLRLTPTHADRTAGLQYLSISQASFSVVVFAVGAIVSSITRGEGPADLTGGLLSYARAQVTFALTCILVLHLPLLAFSRKLLDAKRLADARFSALVARHSRAFEAKWFDLTQPHSPLGAQDMSSQQDITTAFEAAAQMRWIIYGIRPILAILAAGLMLPIIPRLVTERAVIEALHKTLTGIF